MLPWVTSKAPSLEEQSIQEAVSKERKIKDKDQIRADLHADWRDWKMCSSDVRAAEDSNEGETCDQECIANR